MLGLLPPMVMVPLAEGMGMPAEAMGVAIMETVAGSVALT